MKEIFICTGVSLAVPGRGKIILSLETNNVEGHEVSLCNNFTFVYELFLVTSHNWYLSNPKTSDFRRG